MKARMILVSLGLVTLTILSFGLQAQEGTKGTPPASKDDIITSEQQLARQFADFQDALLRLKQRLARGTPEEKKRADVLGKVLNECKNLAINQEFVKMVEILRLARLDTTNGAELARTQSDNLAERLRRILELIQEKGTNLSEERKDLQKIIADLQKAIDKEKTVQGQIDLSKTDPAELAKNQEAVGKDTKKIENAIQKYLDKDNKNGEAANMKGDNKDGGKGDGKKGEAKDAGKQKEGKKGEAKDAGKESDGKKGEAKPSQDNKGNQGDKSPDSEPKAGAKSGEKSPDSKEAGAKGSKAGDPMKDGPQGAAKDNKGGEKKDQAGGAKDSAKTGDPKKDGPQGAAKGDDKKPDGGEKKPGSPDSQAKTGDKGPMDPKQSTAKDSKAGDKASEAKAGGDPKGGDPKQGEAKAGDSKDGQAQAKSDGAPPSGGDPKKGDQAQASPKGDGQPPPPSAGNKQNDDVTKSKKKIEEAGYDLAKSKDNIEKKDNPAASKVAGDAIDKMEAAKKKLEKLLQQMREEEIERVLAALQARCEKMLMMQKQVLAGTEDTEKAITRNADKKPTRENKLESLKLSDKEKDIVQEANKCIDILEAEGSAVAFPEVFQQIRQDMIHVQKRLELTDVADQTQGIERDIIDSLKEMIEALKKARQDNQSEPPPPGQPGKSGQPGDQKLLELIQELKMVRSLQKRVNDRTTDYGKRYNGEQANDAQVIRNLRILAERQQRIQDIVSRISKGDNK